MDSSSTSSSRRRFVVKLAVFIVLVVTLDVAVGSLLRVFYFRQNSGLNYGTTYAIDQSTEDLIVLGSSRAQANYVPAIIEETLGNSCYNAGRDGQSILFSRAMQGALLARHQPDVLVLDLIPMDFYKNSKHYDRLSALLPYYASHEAVRPIVRLRGKYERIKLLSSIYPFNSLPLQILKYNMTKGGKYDGHVPQIGEMSLPMPARATQAPSWVRGELDPNMVQAFESLVAGCTEAGVKLFVVVSPVYEGDVFGRAALEDVQAILAKSTFEFWDYSNHPDLMNNSSLFHDRGHLNKVGAKKFTAIIAKRLQTVLEPETF